ncbi:MAG: T9SS type A sorting domain-containing protein, partial [Candidatus Hodarchaeota archaeon]
MIKQSKSLFSLQSIIISLFTIFLLYPRIWAIEIIQITNSPEREYNPSIAMKDSMICLAWIWEDGQRYTDIVYFVKSTDKAKSWTQPLTIGSIRTFYEKEHPVIVLDHNLYIYIIWRNGEGIVLRKSTNGGLTFTPTVYIAKGNTPHATINGAGDIYLVWRDVDSPQNIYFSKSSDEENNFSEPVLVDSTCAIEYNPPKIAVSPSGNNVYITWDARAKGSPYVRIWFSYSHDGGNTFSPSSQPFPFGHTNYRGNVSSFEEDKVYISGRVDYYQLNHIYFRKSIDKGKSWNTPIRVDDGDYETSDAYEPAMALDESGYICLTWVDTRYGGENNRDIFFDKSILGEKFGFDIQIDTTYNRVNHTDPQIALTDSENIAIVWEDNRNGNSDIYLSHFSVNDNFPPLCFELLEPPNNTKIDTLNPNLKWQKTTDPNEGDSLYYEVLISTDSLFKDNILLDTIVIDSCYTIEKGLVRQTQYFWKVFAFDSHGSKTSCQNIFSFITSETATSIFKEEGNFILKNFILNQNYPNPFNSVTIIKYELPTHCDLTIKIFNINGQLVQKTVDTKKAPGYYSIAWNGKDGN